MIIRMHEQIRQKICNLFANKGVQVEVHNETVDLPILHTQDAIINQTRNDTHRQRDLPMKCLKRCLSPAEFGHSIHYETLSEKML